MNPLLKGGDSSRHEIFNTDANIATDKFEEYRGNVPRMDRDGRASTIGMMELFVGTPLPHFDEAAEPQPENNFTRAKDGDGTHDATCTLRGSNRGTAKALLDANRFSSDQLGFQRRLPILEQHSHNLSEIFPQLFRRLPLGVGAREPGDVADVGSRRVVPLKHRLECAHRVLRIDDIEIYGRLRDRHWSAAI